MLDLAKPLQNLLLQIRELIVSAYHMKKIGQTLSDHSRHSVRRTDDKVLNW